MSFMCGYALSFRKILGERCMSSTSLVDSPSVVTIGELFKADMLFRVPKYQRYYAWQTEEIGDFVNDLKLCVAARLTGKITNHFFGGVLTAFAPPVGKLEQCFEVVDGQQRLATFTMLVAQLCQFLDFLVENADENEDEELLEAQRKRSADLLNSFVKREVTVGVKYKSVSRLTMSKPDAEFFSQLIEGETPAATRPSHENIELAYISLGRALQEMLDDYDSLEAKINVLVTVETVLKVDWTILHLHAQNRDAAYKLFQVLNDRGRSLTEGELLRSRTLEYLDVNESTKLDQVEEVWDKILSEKPTVVVNALRWIYAKNTGKRPGQHSLLDDYLTDSFPMVVANSTSPADLKVCVDKLKELKDDFDFLLLCLNGEWPFEDSPGVVSWDQERLNFLVVELKHTNVMPLLVAARNLKPKVFAEIVHMIERFIFRYKNICKNHIGKVSEIYHRYAFAISSGDGEGEFDLGPLKDELKELLRTSAKYETFRTGILDELYYSKSKKKQVKYFLVTLEYYYRWYKDVQKGKPKVEDKTKTFDFQNTSVEHIYPQKPDNGGDEALDKLLHTLGNLTILGPADNLAAGNKGFEDKRQYLKKSLINLNNDLADLEKWDAEECEERQRQLLEMAQVVFNVS